MALRTRDNAVSRVQRVLALRTFPGFARLPPKDLAVLGEYLRPRSFAAGATLLEAGAAVRAIYLIIDGKVDVVRDDAVRRTYVAKEVVGGLAALAGQPQAHRAIAAEDTVTLEFLEEDLREIFEDNFTITLAVLRALSRTHLQLRMELGEACGYPPVNDDDAFPPLGDLWLVERMRRLRSTLPFGHVSVEAIASLAQAATEVRVAAGSVLWRAGEASVSTLTLLQGVVACETPDGAHRFRFGPESVLGAIDAIAHVPRWYTATAATSVVALRSDADALVDFMEDRPGMAQAMLRLSARSISALLDRAADLQAPAPRVERASAAAAPPP